MTSSSQQAHDIADGVLTAPDRCGAVIHGNAP
jgi:hypothetical protein